MTPKRVALLASLLCAACDGGRGGGHGTAILVSIGVAENPPPVAHARYPAVLEARRAVLVAFPQGGRIARVYVRENDPVAGGDTVAVLSRGSLHAAVAAATAARDQALRTERRIAMLHRTGAASDARLEDARSALEVAEARLHQADHALEDAVLTSPLSGKVVGEVPEEGAVVGPGSPVARIVAADSLDAVAWVGDGTRERVQEGGAAVLRTGAAGQALRGVVTLVSSATDELRGGYRVEVTVVDTTGVLQPGMSAEVELPLAASGSAVMIPADALVARGLGASVFVVDGSRVREVAVEVSELLGSNAVCRGRISPGDSVVVRGAEYLRDGADIEVSDG